jgi:hypothetical protein
MPHVPNRSGGLKRELEFDLGGIFAHSFLDGGQGHCPRGQRHQMLASLASMFAHSPVTRWPIAQTLGGQDNRRRQKTCLDIESRQGYLIDMIALIEILYLGSHL